MYSYLVSKDEYKTQKHQTRVEGQNLFFPKDEDSAKPIRHDEEAQKLTGKGESITFPGEHRQTYFSNFKRQGGERDSISFVPGKKQGPSSVGERQGSYSKVNVGSFGYPHLSTRQGFGGEQSQQGKQVNIL